MTEQEKREQAIAIERRRWWELAESYRRCVEIAREQWHVELGDAEVEQWQIACEMRDRTAPGVRATGKAYDADRSIPVPLFTPRDRVQFLKEVAATLLISADRQNLPVTKAGRREAPQADATIAATDEAQPAEEGTLDAEQDNLADAGEAPQIEAGGLAVSEAP